MPSVQFVYKKTTEDTTAQTISLGHTSNTPMTNTHSWKYDTHQGHFLEDVKVILLNCGLFIYWKVSPRLKEMVQWRYFIWRI